MSYFKQETLYTAFYEQMVKQCHKYQQKGKAFTFYDIPINELLKLGASFNFQSMSHYFLKVKQSLVVQQADTQIVNKLKQVVEQDLKYHFFDDNKEKCSIDFFGLNSLFTYFDLNWFAGLNSLKKTTELKRFVKFLSENYASNLQFKNHFNQVVVDFFDVVENHFHDEKQRKAIYDTLLPVLDLNAILDCSANKLKPKYHILLLKYQNTYSNQSSMLGFYGLMKSTLEYWRNDVDFLNCLREYIKAIPALHYELFCLDKDLAKNIEVDFIQSKHFHRCRLYYSRYELSFYFHYLTEIRFNHEINALAAKGKLNGMDYFNHFHDYVDEVLSRLKSSNQYQKEINEFVDLLYIEGFYAFKKYFDFSLNNEKKVLKKWVNHIFDAYNDYGYGKKQMTISLIERTDDNKIKIERVLDEFKELTLLFPFIKTEIKALYRQFCQDYVSYNGRQGTVLSTNNTPYTSHYVYAYKNNNSSICLRHFLNYLQCLYMQTNDFKEVKENIKNLVKRNPFFMDGHDGFKWIKMEMSFEEYKNIMQNQKIEYMKELLKKNEVSMTNILKDKTAIVGQAVQ